MAYGQTLVSILLDHPAGPAAPIRFSRTAHKAAKEPLQLLSTLQCTGQRHLIDELQMPANRNTIRQPRDLDAERLQRFVLWARFVQLPLDVARNVGGLASLTEHLKALDSETRVVLEHAS